jgi:dGTPase
MNGGNKFADYAITLKNPKWQESIAREFPLYTRPDDIRSEFARDYNRLLHCTAYRRLKHKTQVFFATKNDHICTRIEHVNHVMAISYTISKQLGLNSELTNAIALGHDLGHAPFGHEGENILKNISSSHLCQTFWHERNSLSFVDNIETLQDPNRNEINLNLTYAVRDGIVSHCGEVDENGLIPRDDSIDLHKIEKPGQTPPFTWEGCIVKFSDKISFLGRDIEDSITLQLLQYSQIRDLVKIVRTMHNLPLREINNTVIIHNLIIDLCQTSDPDSGIRFSKEYYEFLLALRRFSNKAIYLHPRLDDFKAYAKLIISTIFKFLLDLYDGKKTVQKLDRLRRAYPLVSECFYDWVVKYSDADIKKRKMRRYQNRIIYNIESRNQYIQSVLDFISGMTDNFAIKIFDELTSF